MKNAEVWFVIVTYKSDSVVLGRLLKALQGWPVEVVDNTQKNLGFGAAANLGMKKAFAAGAQWAVVMNQDIEVTRKGITQFCAMAQQCDPGIVGPEAGELDTVRWTTTLSFSSGKLDYISGSLMAIHRDVWEATGGFYEPYFMYYEDVDICVRARKLGFPLQHVSVEGFRHESDGSNASKEYYLARNHLLFVLRNAPMSVKLYELLRLPKTLWELWS